MGSENLESVGQSGELWQVKRRWDFFLNRSILHLNENSWLVGGGEINLGKEECWRGERGEMMVSFDLQLGVFLFFS